MKDKRYQLTTRLYINMLSAEYADLNDQWKASDIASPFTRVYLVTKGAGYLRYRNTSLELSPGNIYVIPAGLKFSFGCENSLSKAYFHLSILLPSGFDLMEELQKCLIFNDSKTVSEITEYVKNPTARGMLRIQTFLYDLVYNCTQDIKDVPLNEYSAFVTEVMKFIESNLSAKLTVSGIAEALSTSSEKLRKTFRAETGISIGKYIDNLVMLKAELEVRKSSCSIREISDKLGFCDQFYFSRCFSRKFGPPPRVYRQKVLYQKSNDPNGQ